MAYLNCHGCKWLDEVKGMDPGSGYCAEIVRSKEYKPYKGMKIRTADDDRCELYEEGVFEMRIEMRFENGTKCKDSN